MIEEKIIKSEVDILSTAINRIVSSEVLEKKILKQIPLIADLPDTNKIYSSKVSILFVDMRESTKLPDKFDAEQLVKIYRSYIRTVVQAVRYSGGVVRDFMGDGVLAVFIDDEDGKCEDKAVHAARYITTAIDKILNPVLDQEINYRVSCGIGIHTGDISISKVGMKGKEKDDESENEFGVAWIGNSTNLACKFSSAVDSGTIFISSSTYAALSDLEGKLRWEEFEASKGSNILKGYIAKQYYLQLDDDILPCTAKSSNTTLSLVDELKAEYQKQLDDIARKAEELGKKEQIIKDKEQYLNTKEKELNDREQKLNTQEYDFFYDVLGSAHCKKEYIKAMGLDFWEKNLKSIIAAGSKIGKDEHQVKQKISCYMVSIYENLNLYDKAYDFLVEQATGCSWLSLWGVKDIVGKVKYCSRLRFAVNERLEQGDLSSENRKEFELIKNWLDSEM